MNEESHLKSVCWICQNIEDTFVIKATEEILALISMIASLNSPVEREESNHDLHLKSVGFQMQKMLSILLNWKNGIWTQHLPLQQKMFITTKKIIAITSKSLQ